MNSYALRHRFTPILPLLFTLTLSCAQCTKSPTSPRPTIAVSERRSTDHLINGTGALARCAGQRPAPIYEIASTTTSGREGWRLIDRPKKRKGGRSLCDVCAHETTSSLGGQTSVCVPKSVGYHRRKDTMGQPCFYS